MLRNRPIRPVKGDSDRRWLSDDYFDLIIWYDSAQRIIGFQLCYDKSGTERAFTWKAVQSFAHDEIDGGETKATDNSAPVLIADGPLPFDEVRREFLARSRLLPQEMRELVLEKLSEYERTLSGG